MHEVREYQRRYPEGEAAAHVVGFTDIDDRGQEGIELGFQQQLQGRDGQRTVVKRPPGPRGRGHRRPGRPGATAATSTLVDRLQGAVLRLPARARRGAPSTSAKAGSVVVLDVQTGEVLALANCPSYDPNVRNDRRKARRQPDTLRNRVVDRHPRARAPRSSRSSVGGGAGRPAGCEPEHAASSTAPGQRHGRRGAEESCRCLCVAATLAIRN
ncbi:MAG: penicillin-binding transpeptidase domain-containing protein [Comamonadaceae bacterium]|nr:penicillin-binding transpeptidase domain-containing protein [Comamonadaceae bacterium]